MPLSRQPSSVCLSFIPCTLTGIISTVSISAFGVTRFEWYAYETLVDIFVLSGFSVFFLGGVVSNYLVLVAVQRSEPRLLTPFLVFESFLLALSSVVVLIAIGELVSDQVLALQSRRDLQTEVVEKSNELAQWLLLVLPVNGCLQVAKLVAVHRCKGFLRARALCLQRRHREVLERREGGHVFAEPEPRPLAARPGPLQGVSSSHDPALVLSIEIKPLPLVACPPEPVLSLLVGR